MSELSRSRQQVRQQLKEKGEENQELKDGLRAALDETSKLQLLLQVQRPLLSFCQRWKPPVSESRVLICYQPLHTALTCALTLTDCTFWWRVCCRPSTNAGLPLDGFSQHFKVADEVSRAAMKSLESWLTCCVLPWSLSSQNSVRTIVFWVFFPSWCDQIRRVQY